VFTTDAVCVSREFKFFFSLCTDIISCYAHTFVPWASAICYLGLVLDSEFLITLYLMSPIEPQAVLQHFQPSCQRFSAHAVPQVIPLRISYSIHSNLCCPCLELNMLLQLLQTPSYPVKMSPCHR